MNINNTKSLKRKITLRGCNSKGNYFKWLAVEEWDRVKDGKSEEDTKDDWSGVY